MDYICTDTELKAVADSIRSKGSTSESLVWPDGFCTAVSNIETGSTVDTEVPEYVVDGAYDLIKRVKEHQSRNTVSLLCISDMHNCEDTGETSYASNVPAANKHCGEAAYIVAQLIRPDMCCNLGDYLMGGKNATYAYAIEDFRKANAYIASAFALAPNARIWGNHDTLANSWSVNGETMWSESDMTDWVTVHNTGWTWGSELHNYGYMDLDTLRVIMLNSNEVDSITTRPIADAATQYITAEQITWLDSTLESMPDGVYAVILSHHPLDWAASKTRPACDVLEKYASKIMCCLHGHLHNYRVAKVHNTSLEEINVKEIAIPNACFYRTNEYTTSGGITWGTDTTWSKTKDTVNDTAFCVVTIDVENKIIYADHYGAGEDRVISINGYSVSINASGCTVDGIPSSVMSGESISGTITLQDGYQIDSATITMGGTDITSTALSETTITIDSVSGDITITVSASKVVSYTNLIDIQINHASMTLCSNGLINGYRTNSTAGTIGTAYSASVYTASNTGRATVLLPISPGAVIRTKGAYVGSSTNDAVILFDKNYNSVAYTNGTNFIKSATTFGLTYDTSALTSEFTIPDKFPSGATTSTAAYMVLGFTNTRTVGDSEKVIITANEVI